MLRVFKFLIVALIFVAIDVSAREAKANRYSDLDVSLQENDQVVVFPIGYNLSKVEQELNPIKLAIKHQLKALGLKQRFLRFATEVDENNIQYLARAPYEYEKKQSVRAAYSRSIEASAPGAIYLFPSIVQRKAKLKKRDAKWDGVSQSIPIVGVGRSPNVEWSGGTYALSLRIDAHDGEGRWLFTSWGGISLYYYIDSNKGEYVLKDTLFGENRDKKILEEGVKTAFYPFIKKYKVRKK